MLPSLYTSEANSCNSTKRQLTQKATIKKTIKLLMDTYNYLLLQYISINSIKILLSPQFRSIIPCEVLLYIEVTFWGFIH